MHAHALFKSLLFLYMKHFKCIPLVFSHQNVFYLIKPAIVCSENKVWPKNPVKTDLVCQSQYRGQHRSLDDIIFAIHRHKEKVVIHI